MVSRLASFGGIPLHPRLLAALRTAGAHSPLPIQAAAMRRVYGGESLALHSQTGSGKTLAYMLPLLARLREWPPRQVLVVLPSHTLALQTYEVAQQLAAHAGAYGSGGAAMGTVNLLQPSGNVAKRLLQNDASMVVTTMGQFGKLLPSLQASDGVLLDTLRSTLGTIVVDEVDAVLYPRTSVPRTAKMSRAQRQRLLQTLPFARALRILTRRRADAAAPRVQLVCASATLSRRVLRDLSFVVGSEVGKIGLAAPFTTEYPATGGLWSPSTGGADERRNWPAEFDGLPDELYGSDAYEGLDAYEGSEEDDPFGDSADPAAVPTGGEGSWAGVEIGSGTEGGTGSGAEGRGRATAQPAAILNGRVGGRSTGYGVRGGVHHVGIPQTISHEIIEVSGPQPRPYLPYLQAHRSPSARQSVTLPPALPPLPSLPSAPQSLRAPSSATRHPSVSAPPPPSPHAVASQVRERSKGAAIAALMRSEVECALLVVHDRMNLHSVIEELSHHGVGGGVVALPYLATAATHQQRLHAPVGPLDPADPVEFPSWVKPGHASGVGTGPADPSERDPDLAAAEDPDLAMELDMEMADLEDLRRQQLDAGGSDVCGKIPSPDPSAAQRARSQKLLASIATGWRVLVAHESAIRGLDLPQVQVVRLCGCGAPAGVRLCGCGAVRLWGVCGCAGVGRVRVCGCGASFRGWHP